MSAREPGLPASDEEIERRLSVRARLMPGLEDHLDAPEPPPELDRIIVERARRELRREPPQPHRAFPLLNWGLPVAIAATVVLSATLVMQMQSRGPVDASPQVAASSDVASDVPRVSEERQMSEQREAGGTAGAVAETERALAGTAADAAEARRADESRPARESTQPPRAFRRSAPQRDAPNEATEEIVTTSARPEVAQGSGAGNAARAAAPAPAAPPAAAPPAAAPPAAAPAAATAPPADAASPRAADADSDATAAAADAPTLELDPRIWLAEIEYLRSQGRAADAERELAALRARHPDFPIEQELQRLRQRGR